MRYIVFLIVGLLLWGLADDFLVSGLQLSPRVLASDDDEYLLSGAKQVPRWLAEQERTATCTFVLPVDGLSAFAGTALRVSHPDLRAFDCGSRLYIFMSLQI